MQAFIDSVQTSATTWGVGIAVTLLYLGSVLMALYMLSLCWIGGTALYDWLKGWAAR